MKKNLLLLFVVLVSFSGFSQSSLWSPAVPERLEKLDKVERSTAPVNAMLLTLDLEELKSRLALAPSREINAESSVIIPFPDGEGKIMNFRVYEASVLHPELAAQYPDINSYVGQGIEDPSSSIRFSVTQFGLHTMLFTERGTSYTEPYTTDLQNYISYKKSSLKAARMFRCGVTDEVDEDANRLRQNLQMAPQANDGVLRRYRLAMATTVEYSAFQIAAAGVSGGTPTQQVAAVLAAINVTMTRVNGIFERDLSITMQLVPNNSNIIFISSDNLSNDSSMINNIQTIINNGIGFNNYDIGHVFGTGSGGVASLGSVCTTNKARGVTGGPAPVGDPFDVDYVAHEMGHQFGAQHTFNNSFQRSNTTAVEPGSGSTIMAYAGISPPNVQNNSDAYFHTVSIDQIFSFVNSTGGFCAQIIANGNIAPLVAPLQSYTIPKSTAFVLKGSATDANGDALTYCWEQIDSDGAVTNQVPSATSTTGPNFRSITPSTSPNRYMPALSSVLAGNLTPTWEVVPAVARNLNFALTVRDNRVPNGGQTSAQYMTVTVNGTAGPFQVTSQGTSGISWVPGNTETVTWNVAGTTANNINTANVNILLSTDGGQTFSTVLASNTPNDGSHTITVPNVAAAFCRIMVEAVGNIYYAVNASNFGIGATVIETCNTYTNNTPVPIGDGTGVASPGQGPIASSNIIIPASATQTISSVKATVNVTHTFIGDLLVALDHPDDTQIVLWSGNCGNNDNFNVTFQSGAPAISCATPTTGTYAPAGTTQLTALNGKQSSGTWTLLAADFFAGDTGQINSWSLEICSQSVNSVNEFGLSRFNLFPNPNTGSFTVEFESNSASDINITVHDMRGRQILNKAYQNTGVFSGNVNLDNVQSGIYMVTVQDGIRKETRKIVIQ